MLLISVGFERLAGFRPFLQHLANVRERFRAPLCHPAIVVVPERVGVHHGIKAIDDLQAVPAAVRFLSIEPLLGPIAALPLEGIHWVIVGGESGPGRRSVELS